METIIETETDQKIESCLNLKKSFSVIAGAGSGKTTSLVSALNYLKDKYGVTLRQEGKKIVCITYTNRAVEVISSRLEWDNLFYVSTLHKFLWEEIKNYNSDIRNVLKVYLIPLHIKKKKEDDNGGSSQKAQAAREKVALLEEELGLIDSVELFRYSDTNFSNYREGLLNHDDIITVAAYLIDEKDVLRKILGQKYPYIFVDEAQDTFEEVVTALNKLCIDGSLPLIGYFGDPVQQIFDKRAGNFHGPDGSEVIPKNENYRSAPEIISFLNSFRTDVTQYAAGANKDISGSVEIRLVQSQAPAGDRGRYSDEQLSVVTRQFNEALSLWGWEKRQDVKWLFLAKQMIARRLGFPALHSLFTGKYASTRAQEDYDKANHYLLKPFLQVLCPLIRAQGSENTRELLKILRESSPAFDSQGESRTKKLSEMISAINEILKRLHILWSKGSIKEILIFARDKSLWKFSDRLLEDLERDALQEEFDPDIHSEDKGLWLVESFFQMNTGEIEAFYDFVNENTPLSTQHGVKGEQYTDVLVVFDDIEAGWHNYSFTKTLTPSVSGDPTEGQQDRSQKLAYVCFSRAKVNLRILFFTPNPEAAKTELVSKGWFQEAQISIG